tara:strand:- start:466 stop:702 length:237 start_codon:yes stop_codon:yes gene_type:complete
MRISPVLPKGCLVKIPDLVPKLHNRFAAHSLIMQPKKIIVVPDVCISTITQFQDVKPIILPWRVIVALFYPSGSVSRI